MNARAGWAPLLFALLAALTGAGPAHALASAWPDASQQGHSLTAARARRQLVIAFAPPAPTTPLAVARSRRAERLSALGLSPLRSLADAAPIGGERSFDAQAANVVLAEAADSSTADAALAQLASDAQVEWAEPNRVRVLQGWVEDAPDAAREPRAGAPPASRFGGGTPPDGTLPAFPNDPLFRNGEQWGLYNLGPFGPYGGVQRADCHASEAWAVTHGSNSLLLAIADTGIDPSHPDLCGLMPNGAPRLYAGINVTGIDPPEAFADSLGHGTICAGAMAARTNNGASVDTFGMAGLCGGDGQLNAGCRLIAIRITAGRQNEATSFDIATAISVATSLGARAMNLSFAGTDPSRVERLALYQAITHGCVVVGAAGNSANAVAQYPAAYARDGLCIEVGASDVNDNLAYFSSRGPGLDLVAPGHVIHTTCPTYTTAYGASYPGYVITSGTSLAAPLVAATVGLLASVRPELEDDDFQHVIRESAHDIGEPGVDSLTAWGRLDAEAALAAVGAGIGIWHGSVAGVAGAVVGTDTLSLDESVADQPDHGRLWPNTEAIEVLATVAIPDSFSGAVRVWPRVAGTLTVRGGFRLPYFAPWAEVVAQGQHSFTLRGYVYHRLDACAGCDEYLPLPPDQASFGFTVMGPVTHAVPVAASSAPLRALPNPVTGATRIEGAPNSRVTVCDLAGRRVREAVLDASGGAWVWDGVDDHGRRVAPGIYLVRSQSPAGARSQTRLVVLR